MGRVWEGDPHLLLPPWGVHCYVGGRPSWREESKGWGGCPGHSYPLSNPLNAQPLVPNCLVVSLFHVAISKDDQSILICALIAALG